MRYYITDGKSKPGATGSARPYRLPLVVMVLALVYEVRVIEILPGEI